MFRIGDGVLVIECVVGVGVEDDTDFFRSSQGRRRDTEHQQGGGGGEVDGFLMHGCCLAVAHAKVESMGGTYPYGYSGELTLFTHATTLPRQGPG